MRPFKIRKKDLTLYTLILVFAYGGGFYLSQNPELQFKIFGASTNRVILLSEEAPRFSADFRWAFYRSTGVKLSVQELEDTETPPETCYLFGSKEFLAGKSLHSLPESLFNDYHQRVSPDFMRYSLPRALLLAWKTQESDGRVSIIPYYFAFTPNCPEILVNYASQWWLGPINYLNWISENKDLLGVRSDMVSPIDQSPERIKDLELPKIAPH